MKAKLSNREIRTFPLVAKTPSPVSAGDCMDAVVKTQAAGVLRATYADDPAVIVMAVDVFRWVTHPTERASELPGAPRVQLVGVLSPSNLCRIDWFVRGALGASRVALRAGDEVRMRLRLIKMAEHPDHPAQRTRVLSAIGLIDIEYEGP
ncbi:MAG: hypothetical protein ACHREM_24425 [Polyangiales bacterium]